MLPEKFTERMKRLLGDEYAKLATALEEPMVRGARVNTAKTDEQTFKAVTDLSLTALPYTDVGFIAEGADSVGRLPEHHSGMIYMQDPGAMATVCALDVQPGWWVLDACAAPGGKSTQLSAIIGDDGFLLSNEYVPKRAKISVGNMERLGVKNALVTSLDTAELSELFSEAFDLVLCDAPCSGEGMFRKYDEALEEWSEENVLACAERQAKILDNLAPLVKPEGYLLYSTCTYAPEENEITIDAFIDRHPEFSISPISEKVRSSTAPGITPDGCDRSELSLTARFYPHVSKGEGQYVALLQKNGENSRNLKTILYKSSEKSPANDEISAIEKFFSDALTSRPNGRLIKHGEYVVLVPHSCPIPPRSVFMAGVTVGEVRRGVVFPHHQFFSAYGHLFKLKENLKKGDDRVFSYLHGEEISSDMNGSGWCAVCYEGAPLGGGKLSCGRIKNHYPKGLRNK